MAAGVLNVPAPLAEAFGAFRAVVVEWEAGGAFPADIAAAITETESAARQLVELLGAGGKS